jgi:phage-related protein (TIGR01555 family)
MARKPTKSVARSAKRERNRQFPTKLATADSYQNLATRTGMGAGSQNDFATYSFYPITRLRIVLDFAYRSSWICRAAVEAVAEDMTREGFDLGSDLDPKHTEQIHTAFGDEFMLWDRLCETIGYARLYGGAGAYIMIDGQKPDTPLRLDTIGKDSFCGLLALDRWLVEPSLTRLVTDQRSPDFGKPQFYRTVGDTPLPPSTNIHHTRFIRFEGAKLPYYQRLAENLWDMSVLEPLWDRLLAFDQTTSGAAQLVNRAHLRNLYIENWKETVGSGGDLLAAQLEAIEWIRRYQQNEGITVLDATDRLEALSYAFTGLDAILIQMGQQISGSLGIPLVRLFGQSPVGLNSTGEADLRMYYDMLKSQQERKLKSKINYILRVLCASKGIKLPDGFNWMFNPLWQLQEQEKVNIASTTTQTVLSAFESGVITKRATILKELSQVARRTGVWTNITDEEIEAAEKEPEMPGINELGGDPSQFLPGGGDPNAEQPADNFLPGTPEHKPAAPSFLPGGNKTLLGNGGAGEYDSEEDSLGALEEGELEREDRKVKKPIFHVYVNDQDLQGRETKYAGFDIVVEVEKGEKRYQGSSEGATMTAPYGYFPGTVGNDGDCVDVFLGDNEKSNMVVVVDQCDPDTKRFHQQKVFLGFSKPKDVLDTFYSFYADGRGRDRIMRAKEMTMPDFRKHFEKFRAPQKGLSNAV